MNDRLQKNALFIMGVLGLLGTLYLQVMRMGHLEGNVTTLLALHSADIMELKKSDKQQDQDIAEMKGKLHSVAVKPGKTSIPFKTLEGQVPQTNELSPLHD
jgi:hypothetical protein